MPMSDEQRKAASERMKAIHDRKRAEKELNKAQEQKTTLNPGINDEPKETISVEDYNALLSRIQELETAKSIRPSEPQVQPGVQATSQGLVGTRERYIVDPNNYPSPIDRLAKETRLQRFAFGENYELTFNVSVSSYKTLDGINTKEPKFTLELHRVVFDEDTGEPTNGRYVVCRGIFHEDPEAAIVIANDNGIIVDQSNQKEFLDEMRYLRMRDWLLEAFYPPRPQDKKKKKEMVIGNKLVEYFEINSENSESIPFSQLKGKV